jgi:hypothetical protein
VEHAIAAVVVGGGISVADCVDSARAMAERITAHLGSPGERP